MMGILGWVIFLFFAWVVFKVLLAISLEQKRKDREFDRQQGNPEVHLENQ